MKKMITIGGDKMSKKALISIRKKVKNNESLKQENLKIRKDSSTRSVFHINEYCNLKIVLHVVMKMFSNYV